MKTAHCTGCGMQLINDEVALNIKFFGLGRPVLLCCSCLSAKLDMPLKRLHELAVYYKSSGCTIFHTQYVTAPDTAEAEAEFQEAAV